MRLCRLLFSPLFKHEDSYVSPIPYPPTRTGLCPALDYNLVPLPMETNSCTYFNFPLGNDRPNHNYRS